MASTPGKKVDYVAKLVVQALKELKDSNGSSFSAIKDHIAENYSPSSSVMKRLPLAIRKGIVFGAIKKNRGLYILDALMTMAARHGRRRRRRSKSKRRSSRRRSRRRGI